MNLAEKMNQLAHFGAGWVMWLLLSLSLVAVAITLERALLLWLTRENVPGLRAELVGALRAADLERARRTVQETTSLEGRVAQALLDAHAPAGAEELLKSALLDQRVEYERHLGWLATIGSNAPFVGLLGTVIGIVRAFGELDRSAGQVSAGLMAEVGESLVATAVGLCVALPAVAAYNALGRVISARLARAESLGRELLAESH